MWNDEIFFNVHQMLNSSSSAENDKNHNMIDLQALIKYDAVTGERHYAHQRRETEIDMKCPYTCEDLLQVMDKER